MLRRGRRAHYEWVPIARDLARRAGGLGPIGARTLEIGISTPSVGISGTSPALPESMSLSEALTKVGLPQSNLAPEDELVDLLQNAAEIEHGLLIQYLYATYSSIKPVIGGLLKEIAIEEMGHFMTVQNMLLACGAQPYLGHSDWIASNLFRPFPFTLEPVSKESIAKYTTAEMPDLNSAHLTPEQKDLLPAILADARMSAGYDVEAYRVGLLYMKIYWLLRFSDAELLDPSQEPWFGFPVKELAETPTLAGRHIREGFLQDVSARNGLARHWRGTHQTLIVESITNRDDALRAIAAVSAQGEGFGTTPDGHFDRFVLAWQQANVEGPIAVNAAVDPWYAPRSEGDSRRGNEITSPVGILFARIADGVYEFSLLATALYLLLPASVPSDTRRKAARAAIATMKDGLGIAAMSLRATSLCQGGGAEDLVCGLPFSFPPIDVAADASKVLARARVLKGEIEVRAAEVTNTLDATQSQIDDAASISRSVVEHIWPLLEALPVTE